MFKTSFEGANYNEKMSLVVSVI